MYFMYMHDMPHYILVDCIITALFEPSDRWVTAINQSTNSKSPSISTQKPISHSIEYSINLSINRCINHLFTKPVNNPISRWSQYVQQLPWKINFINIHALLTSDQLKNVNHFHRCACIRLFLANLVPHTVDKMFYVDADTIMVGNIHSVLREMNAIRHPAAFMGAVPEISLARNASFWYADKTFPWLRPHGANSGVMIFHLQTLNQTRFTDRQLTWNSYVTEAFDQYADQFELGDQDFLNVAMNQTSNSWYYLPDGFNFRLGSTDMKTAGDSENELVILHGNGGSFDDKDREFYNIHQYYRKMWE